MSAGYAADRGRTRYLTCVIAVFEFACAPMLTAYAAYVAGGTADITLIVAARNGRRAADIAHYAADSRRAADIGIISAANYIACIEVTDKACDR